MTRHYVPAVAAGAAGLGSIVWALLGGAPASPILLLVAATATPVAVALAVSARIAEPFPLKSFLGGALIGPVFAVATHGLVAAFAAAFLLGFADSGRRLLDALLIDPRLTTVLGSPWVLLALIELTAVAPLTEEIGKTIGSRLFRPRTAREAFLAGVAAGAGFAAVENVLYAVAGAVLRGPWPAVVLGRAMGAAVHPLATGLVALGWWEWKETRSPRRLAGRFLAGAGVHALWNGSLAALWVVGTAFAFGGGSGDLGPVALTYMAALGMIAGAALWMATGAVCSARSPFAALDFTDARTVAAWSVLAASFLVPVGMLVLAFPRFYSG